MGERVFWYANTLECGGVRLSPERADAAPNGVLDDGSEEGYDILEDRYVTDFDNANLVGSAVKDAGGLLLDGRLTPDRSIHKPALDLDIPAQLFPSRTPGHFHLYIDKELTWTQYEKLLEVLAECGIIEPNYASVSIARGQTFLRKPLTGERPTA